MTFSSNFIRSLSSHSTLQMLTNIENRLEELFEQIEMMPPDKVEMAEKVGIMNVFSEKYCVILNKTHAKFVDFCDVFSNCLF